MTAREEIEADIAKLIAAYYRREIGVLMHQAEHWAAHGKPLAVHHRVFAADQVYQIVSLMERDTTKGWAPPFEQMRRDLARVNSFGDGTYPPSRELHAYRDPRFVVEKLLNGSADVDEMGKARPFRLRGGAAKHDR